MKKVWGLSSLHKKSYGHNAVAAPKADRCCEEVCVFTNGWPHHSQCSRPRGHGPEEAYCKQHDPVAVAERDAASRKKQERKWAEKKIEWNGPKFLAALRLIAKGHNDPRQLAIETIGDFGLGDDADQGNVFRMEKQHP